MCSKSVEAWVGVELSLSRGVMRRFREQVLLSLDAFLHAMRKKHQTPEDSYCCIVRVYVHVSTPCDACFTHNWLVLDEDGRCALQLERFYSWREENISSMDLLTRFLYKCARGQKAINPFAARCVWRKKTASNARHISHNIRLRIYLRCVCCSCTKYK